MAKKLSASEKPRKLLPCIGEDKMLDNPSLSQVSKPKSSSRRRDRVHSDPNVPNAEQVKNASGKKDSSGEDGKGRMLSSNRKKVPRRGSVPQGFFNSSDSKATFKEAAKKARRASKKDIQQDKPPSPDIIDLSNEKVAQELLLRLYETLRVTEKEAHESAPVEQNDLKIESRKTELGLSSKSENTMRFHRQNVIGFPQLSKSTSNLEVFYSKPVSWKCLISRQLQRRKRPTNFLPFQDSLTRSDQLGRKELHNRQVSRMTWACCNYSPPGTSRPLLHDRGLSVPLLMRHSNAFVKTSFESRKSVTFAV